MKKKAYILGLFAFGMMVFQACNHPRTENEQERQPENRLLSPHERPASTTDTAHNDSIREHDPERLEEGNDPATPNF